MIGSDFNVEGTCFFRSVRKLNAGLLLIFRTIDTGSLFSLPSSNVRQVGCQVEFLRRRNHF